MTDIKPEYTGQALDLSPAADSDEWQPMETALRDGERIEVWHDGYKCTVVVMWADDISPPGAPWVTVVGADFFSEIRFTGWRHPSKGPE